MICCCFRLIFQLSTEVLRKTSLHRYYFYRDLLAISPRKWFPEGKPLHPHYRDERTFSRPGIGTDASRSFPKEFQRQVLIYIPDRDLKPRG